MKDRTNPNDSTDPNDSTPGDETSTDGRPRPAELGFSGCLAELDRIVKGLETDSVDVDELADTVNRAAELVEWCQARLGDTKVRLEEVLPRLGATDAVDPDPGPTDRAGTKRAPE